MYVRVLLRKESIVGGYGLGRVYDHINHFGYYINEVWIIEGRGLVAVLKELGKNTACNHCM